MKIDFRELVARNAQALMESSESLNSHAKIHKRCRELGFLVGSSTIGRLMKASGPSPTLETLVAFAAVFKIPPSYLISLDFLPYAKRMHDAPGPEVIELAKRLNQMPKEILRLVVQDGVTGSNLRASEVEDRTATGLGKNTSHPKT